jgi:hypothetical protein
MEQTASTPSPVQQLFGEHLEEIPEEWHDSFATVVGQGASPSGVIATIEYLTTSKTQVAVAAEFDVSAVTIRNLQDLVAESGPATTSCSDRR